jgi:hypothetical protein
MTSFILCTLDTDPCVARIWLIVKYTIQIDKIKKEQQKEINFEKKNIKGTQ